MKLYLKLLFLLALLTVITFKVMTATEKENRVPAISQQATVPVGPDLRSLEIQGDFATTRISLATSGYYERSGTFWY